MYRPLTTGTRPGGLGAPLAERPELPVTEPAEPAVERFQKLNVPWKSAVKWPLVMAIYQLLVKPIVIPWNCSNPPLVGKLVVSMGL